MPNKTGKRDAPFFVLAIDVVTTKRISFTSCILFLLYLVGLLVRHLLIQIQTGIRLVFLRKWRPCVWQPEQQFIFLQLCCP